MRSITGVQAVQFWLKLIAVVVPGLIFLAVWRLQNDADAARAPYFHRPTTVTAGASAGIPLPAPPIVAVPGVRDGRRYRGEHILLGTGSHRVRPGAQLGFPAGA